MSRFPLYLAFLLSSIIITISLFHTNTEWIPIQIFKMKVSKRNNWDKGFSPTLNETNQLLEIEEFQNSYFYIKTPIWQVFANRKLGICFTTRNIQVLQISMSCQNLSYLHTLTFDSGCIEHEESKAKRTQKIMNKNSQNFWHSLNHYTFSLYL